MTKTNKSENWILSTNKFKLDQSDIQLDFLIEKNKLKSFSFDIKKLNFKKKKFKYTCWKYYMTLIVS